MTNQSVTYVVAAESRQESVSQIIDSLRSNKFLSQTEIRVVTPSEFEKTNCFKEARNNRSLIATYYRFRDRKEFGDSAMTHPELNEQAVLLFASQLEPRSVLHEFVHCIAVKTNMGIELRSEYSRVAPELDRAIGTQYSRQLAEAIILLPEDAWIEKQVLQCAAEDEKNLGISAENYVKNMLDTFSRSLEIVRNEDGAREDWKRVQTALHRIRYCLNCVMFAEIAITYPQTARLESEFVKLSKKFRDYIDLTGVDVNGLWNVSKGTTVKPWVDACASTLIRVVRSARAR